MKDNVGSRIDLASGNVSNRGQSDRNRNSVRPRKTRSSPCFAGSPTSQLTPGHGRTMRLHCLGTVGYHPNDSSAHILLLPARIGNPARWRHRCLSAAPFDRDRCPRHPAQPRPSRSHFWLDVPARCCLFERPLRMIRIWGEAAKIEAIRQHLFHELIFPAKLDAEWMAIDALDQWRDWRR